MKHSDMEVQLRYPKSWLLPSSILGNQICCAVLDPTDTPIAESGKVYEVLKIVIHDGKKLYKLHGVVDWVDSRWFIDLKDLAQP